MVWKKRLELQGFIDRRQGESGDDGEILQGLRC